MFACVCMKECSGGKNHLIVKFRDPALKRSFKVISVPGYEIKELDLILALLWTTYISLGKSFSFLECLFSHLCYKVINPHQ